MTPHESRYLLLCVLALAAMLSWALPAHAVDIENRDNVPRDVTINSADGSSDTITVKAGAKMTNICGDCVILTPTSSVEARGKAKVKIERGDVAILSR